MRWWRGVSCGLLAIALFWPSAAFALSLGDILNDERTGAIIDAAILLNDDAAEEIASTLGTAEVERKGLCTDPALTLRADRVFRRVAAGATRKGCRVRVLNDASVNACAVPGGHVYLNRGLLTVPGITDDEIAAVVGHEIAHVEKRHGLQQIRQAVISEFVAGKLTKKGQQRAVAVLAGQLWVSGRSQKDEREADLVGARLARSAHYSATGAVAFMRRMEVMSRNERSRHPGGSALLSALDQRLASHPPTEQRCEYLKDDLFTSKYGEDFRLAGARPGRTALAGSGTGRGIVSLQQNPVHIGDDQAGIATIWSKPFDLAEADLVGRTSAKVVFLLRSTEIKRDPNVYFNRVHVGFAVTRSRNWERFEFDVPLSALHTGRNLVDIETIIPDLWQTYDDCEFKGVKLLLSGSRSGPTETKGADEGVGVPIVVHFHTVFSDGSKRPEEAKWGLEAAANGLIVTDHTWDISEIGSERHQIYEAGQLWTLKRKPDRSYGYTNYINSVSRQSTSEFISIPGAELSYHNPNSEQSHLLVLDISDPGFRRAYVTYDESGRERSGKGRKLVPNDVWNSASAEERRALVAYDDLLAATRDRRIPTVAAHPANRTYRFPLGDASHRKQHPRLVEFFNNGIIDGAHDVLPGHGPADRVGVEQGELGGYLALLTADGEVGVTAGSDFHTDAVNNDEKLGVADQWHRYTYLCGAGARPSRAAVLSALYEGRTYAAVEDAACLELSPQPAIEPQPAKEIKVSATLRRGRGSAKDVRATKVFLFRVVGTKVDRVKEVEWSLKQDTVQISWREPNPKRGTVYSYFIYAPAQLITSPIRLKAE